MHQVCPHPHIHRNYRLTHQEFGQGYWPLVSIAVKMGYFIQRVQRIVGRTQKTFLRVHLGGNVKAFWYLTLEELA